MTRTVGSNFQLVRPRYCDHNTAACNRHVVGMGGGVPPSARSAEALSVFILEIQHCTIVIIVAMEYQKLRIQTRVVRMVTKVKGRHYFFVIIKRLINITISSVWQINNRRLRTQRSRDDP